MTLLDTIHGAAIRGAFGARYGRRPYGRYATFLERSQWWPAAGIEALQMRKLAALVQHPSAAMPVYRQGFDADGVRPAET